MKKEFKELNQICLTCFGNNKKKLKSKEVHMLWQGFDRR